MFALWRKDVYLSHLTFRLVPRLFNWNVSVFINCQHCTQAVKNSPAMLETLVRSLGWEDALEKEMATLSSILAWRISWTEEPSKLHGLQPQVHGVTKSRMWLSDSHTDTHTHTLLLKMAGRGTLSQSWKRGPTLRQEVCIISQGG